MQNEEMYTFNPYRILAIEEGAEPGEIKKASGVHSSVIELISLRTSGREAAERQPR